jgi:hypothetical protein
MAAAQMRATHLLCNVEDVVDERIHAAWFQLASLADCWTDLVSQADSMPHPIAVIASPRCLSALLSES